MQAQNETGDNSGRPTAKSTHRSSYLQWLTPILPLTWIRLLPSSSMVMKEGLWNVVACWLPHCRVHWGKAMTKTVLQRSQDLLPCKSTLLGIHSVCDMLFLQSPRLAMIASQRLTTPTWSMWPSLVRSCCMMDTWTRQVGWDTEFASLESKVTSLTCRRLATFTGLGIRRPSVVKSVALRKVAAHTALLAHVFVMLKRLLPPHQNGYKQWQSNFLGWDNLLSSAIFAMIKEVQQIFFKSDIWHVVHLGFGRSWVASVLQVCLPLLPMPNLDEKWNYLTEEYLDWCAANRKQAHISRITPYLMSYGQQGGAMGCWYKGALTTNFLHWLVDFLGKVPNDPDGHIMQCRCATYRLNSMFSMLYKAGAFLSEEECQFVSEQGLRFLESYSLLAHALFMQGRQQCFPLYPKLHTFHHIVLEVRASGIRAKIALNPLIYSCQMDEDCIGRTARLSRRVSIRQVSARSLDRFLVASYTAFVKAGLLQWKKHICWIYLAASCSSGTRGRRYRCIMVSLNVILYIPSASLDNLVWEYVGRWRYQNMDEFQNLCLFKKTYVFFFNPKNRRFRRQKVYIL